MMQASEISTATENLAGLVLRCARNDSSVGRKSAAHSANPADKPGGKSAE
jgi:hypothetical protein